jgi:hypothetical protein
MAKRLRILHLSDLHMGQERGAARWRLRDVLGQAWRDNLDAIAQDRQVDLVCFTGDLAFSGKPEQYREAGEAIEFLLQQLNLDKSRFFCVPGNHDIDRDLEADAWRQLRDAHDVRPEDFDPWIAGGRAPPGCEDAWIDAVLLRRRAYDDWLTTFGLDHLRPQHHRHGRLGYRITFAPGELDNAAPLHIVGFDSAWLAGDGDDREQDIANLRLTREQAGRLLSDDNGDPLTGHAIGLVHHPFSYLIETESQSMLGLMSRKGLGLLLHGHLHDLRMSRWSDPDHGLYISSAGSQYQRNDVPNTIHLIDVALPAGQPMRPATLWVRAWDGDGGHWYSDNKRYRHMVDGRLKLTPDDPVPFTPTPGTFVGRTNELDQLRAALLPVVRSTGTQPTVICCAIDGMPGVGKTRLAEQFITGHWLQAYPPPPDTPSGECVLRLVLSSGEDQTSVRSADVLLRDLADRLKLRGTTDDVRRDLPPALQCGPGGHPRLVLIENVDSDAQAEQVAALVHGLPGCPVLVTARVRKFGGQHWERVEVKPLLMEDAIRLLRDEAKAAGDDAYVPDETQARDLAETLGRLPLALHIAASHLGLGKTPNEFLDELRATGLDLAPAQYGDHGLQVDRARAILRSSFDLSWKAWCAGAGKSTEWQQALVALAHGPAEGVGESLGAAITALPQAQYGPCLVAAGRLSLLEWEWAGDGEMREREVRLHALIAEFLRTFQQPDAVTVIARIGDWIALLMSEGDEHAIGRTRQTVKLVSAVLGLRLSQAPWPEALRLIGARDYVNKIGRFEFWLACFERSLYKVLDLQSRLSLRVLIALALIDIGDLERALQAAHNLAQDAKIHGRERQVALDLDQIAEILQSRGELEAALRIHRDEILPAFDRLDHASWRDVTQGETTYILQSPGDLEGFLIRRVEEIPVFRLLGDVANRAITQGKIADILQSRGELEESLRIRRMEQMPAYERLGDARLRTITQGKIADILQSRGEWDEALRIRREEELPVYERLSDVRSLLVGRANLAITLAQRGRPEDRPEALTLLQQALSEAERLRLPEAGKIRGLIAHIFGDGDDGVLPS